jgi:redox-sensitive bicupin YhaK (pirin superfamily)
MVMNNDIIELGGGFPTHPHQDAEIFTYVLSGKLEHKDSMGNGSVIEAGDLQYMSAGEGVQHSEFNPSDSEPTELYQIWMRPNQRGGKPRYAEKKLSAENFGDKNKLLFSEDGRDGSVAIRQDAEVHLVKLEAGESFKWKPNPLLPNLWIQLIEGEISVNDYKLKKADGLGIEDVNEEFSFAATSQSKFFIFCVKKSNDCRKIR